MLDCCQGSAILWSRLRDEFPVAAYLGLDIKPQKGRLRLDSRRYLALPGWDHDVIDIDTYGSCWAHWEALLPNVVRPTTVFLTWGQGGPNRIGLSRYELNALGLTLPRVHRMSGAIVHNLAKIVLSYVLTNTCGYATITEAVEAISNGNARYFGVRLEPIKTNGRKADTSGRSKHPEPVKEVQHV